MHSSLPQSIPGDVWLRVLWDESSVPHAVVDHSGYFSAANTEFCELVGYTEGQLRHRTWQSITDPQDLADDQADEVPGLSTGDNIVEVNDLSTNTNDLTTIGGSPTWESTVVNGHAVLRGDGASDYIQGTFAASVTGGNYVIGIVRKWNSAYSAQEVLVDGSGQFQGAYYRTSSNVGNAFYNNGSPLIGSTTGPTDQWGYVECRVDGASSTVKVNGNTVAPGTLRTTTLTGLTLFADGATSQKSDADIAEVFVVNTPSSDDLAALEAYALAEYGLAPPPGATANIVCVGDSNTAGTLTFAESYPAQLQGLLNSSYPNAYVVNTGVGGVGHGSTLSPTKPPIQHWYNLESLTF